MPITNVLDLVGEFAFLNDTKVQSGGHLAPDDEKRWAALNAYYGKITAPGEASLRFPGRTISASDVRSKVPWRERLRVPVDVYALMHYQGGCLVGRVANLSWGGLFLACRKTLPSPSLVYVILHADRYGVPVCELGAEVIWTNNEASETTSSPPGMGIRFLNVADPVKRQIDSVMVEALKQRLSEI